MPTILVAPNYETVIRGMNKNSVLVTCNKNDFNVKMNLLLLSYICNSLKNILYNSIRIVLLI